MAALRTRISTLLVIFMVAVLAAVVGYQLAQSSAPAEPFRGSATIDLLDRKKGPPPACYKKLHKDGSTKNHPEKNPNCPDDD